MTRADIDALLARHHAAFASHDPVALAADHTEDGTFESPAHGKVTGREAIQQVYRYWLTAVPDMQFDWTTPIVEGDRVALFWFLSGTIQGPFFGDVRPGTKLDMHGASEFVLADAGIVSVRHVFDFSAALLKAGVLKLRPS